MTSLRRIGYASAVTDCCAGETMTAGEARCPVTQARGLRVSLDTVKALLTTDAMPRLRPECVHYLCPDPGCDIVYFSDSAHLFSRRDVRVPVACKQPPGDRIICYCFGETESTIRDEVLRAGVSTAERRIRAHIAAGRCACEVRNPRGSCCLGDVRRAVAAFRQDS